MLIKIVIFCLFIKPILNKIDVSVMVAYWYIMHIQLQLIDIHFR